MEEAAEGEAVEEAVREEAGLVEEEEEEEAAEVLEEVDLQVGPPQQPVIRADRRALSAQAEIEVQACWAASRSRSSQHLSSRKSSSHRCLTGTFISHSEVYILIKYIVF